MQNEPEVIKTKISQNENKKKGNRRKAGKAGKGVTI